MSFAPLAKQCSLPMLPGYLPSSRSISISLGNITLIHPTCSPLASIDHCVHQINLTMSRKC